MKKQNEKSVSKLKLHKETLRQLELNELERVGGGITSPSLCMATTDQCCVTL